MKILLISLAVVLSSSSALAYDYDNFCSNTDGLNEIKANVMCRSGRAILGCGLLGGAVAGTAIGSATSAGLKLAGQNLAKAEADRVASLGSVYLSSIHNAREEVKGAAAFEAELRKKLADQQEATQIMDRGSGWDDYARQSVKYAQQKLDAFLKAKNAAGDGKLFKPVIQEIDGRIYDIANGPVPDVLIKKYNELAKYGLEQIRKHGFDAKGGPWMSNPFNLASSLDSEWERMNSVVAYRTSLNQNIDILARQLLKSPDYKDLPSRGFINLIKEAGVDKPGQNAAGKVAETILKKIAAKTAGVESAAEAGGVVGGITGAAIAGAAYLAGETLGADKVACAELGEQDINLDAGCKIPTYKVNRPVADFLAADEARQLDSLRLPRVCDFYKKLHQEMFKRPDLKGLNCNRNSEGKVDSFVVHTKTGDTSTDYSAKLSDNKISMINSKINDTIQRPFTINLDSDENISSYELDPGKISSQTVRYDRSQGDSAPGRMKLPNEQRSKLMLFLPEAKDCCAQIDPSAASQCLSSFQGQPPSTSDSAAAPGTSSHQLTP